MNEKTNLKLFDIDDTLVTYFHIDFIDNHYHIYIDVRSTASCCPTCGFIKLLGNGNHKMHLPRILLIDEFFFGSKAKYKYPTLFMNFENNLIIDIVKSRIHEVLTPSFFSIPKEEKEVSEYICTDISFTFKPLLPTFFPNATLIIDHFHLTKHINGQLNKIRIRIMNNYKSNKK